MEEKPDYGDRAEVHRHSDGGCEVKVFRLLDEGEFVVVRTFDEKTLSVFSFNNDARNSLPRAEAEQRAEEYANGYVAGYSDGVCGMKDAVEDMGE